MSLDIVLLIIVVLLFIFASTSYIGLIIDLIKKFIKKESEDDKDNNDNI